MQDLSFLKMILSYPHIDPTIEEYDGSEIVLNLQLP